MKQLITKLIERKQNIWIWGKPGIGKSYLVNEIANEKLIPMCIYPCGPSTLIEDILGLVNIHGEVVHGPLVTFAKSQDTGIFLLEEIDLLNAKVQNQLNLLLQEHKAVIPGVEDAIDISHITFVATANTNGVDMDMKHETRSLSDASLISRFIKIHMQPDLQVELKLCDNNYYTLGLMQAIRESFIPISEDTSMRQSQHITELLKILHPKAVSDLIFRQWEEWDLLLQNTAVCQWHQLFIKQQPLCNDQPKSNVEQENKIKEKLNEIFSGSSSKPSALTNAEWRKKMLGNDQWNETK